MSDDDVRPGDAPVSSGAGTAAPPSFGVHLAAARERAGMSVGEVASRLRLHVNQVRAIESENLAQLPEAAYVRGFVRSYARVLGLDPAPLIDDLNAKLAPAGASVVEGMTHTPDYSPVRAAAHEQASRWIVLGLAVAALVALGLIGWYATREPPPPASFAPPVRAPMAVSAPTPAPMEQAVSVAAAPSEASAEPASADAQAPEPMMGAGAAPAEASALLSLSFSGVSWVEVTDANGRVLVSQLARAGDVLQPAGAVPLAVVLGDATQVSATVRGAAFDLATFTRSNVARFTVK